MISGYIQDDAVSIFRTTHIRYGKISVSNIKATKWNIDCDWPPHIYMPLTWWRHQMETFFALLALCEGNPPITAHRWIRLTKASDVQLFYFLWSAPEQTVEQTNETQCLKSWGYAVIFNPRLMTLFVADEKSTLVQVSASQWKYMIAWCLNSAASCLFVQKFVRVNNKAIFKFPNHWPLRVENRPVVRTQKGQ